MSRIGLSEMLGSQHETASTARDMFSALRSARRSFDFVLIDQSFFAIWMGAPPALFTAPLAALVLWRWNSVKLFMALMLASFWRFSWKTH